MADQAITALPKKTYSGSSQIASTDYLLGIDSAEGYQMLIQDLGEYIINRATASLAGSTQTLASAISALNSNIKAMPDTDNGRLMYRSDAHADSLVNNIVLTRTGCPENDFFYIKTMAYTKKQDGTVSTGHQIALSYNNDDRIYTRRCESGTWRPWVKVPTRAEVDALNSKTSGTMLWSGANAYDGDTITLSQPVTNFTWLLFMFRTNSEVSTVLFRADHATNDRPYANIQAGEWMTDTNRFQYCAWSSVTKTSATTYTVSCKYNNANFICRPLAIWGF